MTARSRLEASIRNQARGRLAVRLGLLLVAVGVVWPIAWLVVLAYPYAWSPELARDELAPMVAFAVVFLGLLLLGVRKVVRVLRAPSAGNLK